MNGSPPLTLEMLIDKTAGVVNLPNHIKFVTFEWVEKLYEAIKPHLEKRRAINVPEGANENSHL